METNKLIHGNLGEEIVKECDNVHMEIKKVRAKIQANIPIPPGDLFILGEYLTSWRFWITAYLLESEALFREKMDYFREKKNESVSGSEVKAKNTPEYRAYNYLRRLDSLVEEQVLLVKKFADRMNAEGKFL